MKKMLTIFCCSMVICYYGDMVSADEITRELNGFHHKLVIRNRARTRGTSHLGRVMYQYTNCHEYDGEYAGNLVADATVRQVYSYTSVTEQLIQASDNPVEIGNLMIEGRTTEVVNIVEVQGDIHSLFQPVSIGNVHINNQAGTIRNQVVLTGSIYAH